MAYLPPNAGRMNVTLGGNTAGAMSTVSTGTLGLHGGDNVTLSQNGNNVTVSAWQNFDNLHVISLDGNTLGDVAYLDHHMVRSFASNNITFSASVDNGVSPDFSGHASVSIFGPTTHRITLGGNSTSAGAGYGQVSSGTLTLAGGNNITLSQNGNAVTISGPNALTSQSAQTLGMYATGANTTGQSSSNTLDARSFSISAQGGLFAGMSGNTLQLSAATTYAASNHSHGNPTLNLTNLNGTTASASNGLTLSLSAPNQTAQTVGFYATGANTTGQSSSNTFDARSMSVSAQGGLFAGMSGNTIHLSAATTYAASNHSHGNPTLNLTNISGTTASASNGLTLSLSAPNQTAQTVGFYATGANTTGQSSSNTFDARSMSISAQGGLYAGMSGNTIHLSAATTYAASNHSHGNPTLALTNISGTTASASNGLTLSLSAAAPGAGGGVALYDGVNSITSGTARLSTFGALTASVNGQTLSLSVPATSSLSATGALSLSTNGSTISIGAPTQTAQTVGFYATGANTTGQSSSNTFDARSMSISAQGGLFAGMSGNTIHLSAATTYAASNHSHGNPTLNLTNISGTTASASNGLTLSLSAASQSNQQISAFASSGTYSSSSGTINASNMRFVGSGNVSVGVVNGSVMISGGGGAGGGIALRDGANSITSGTASISGVNLTASVNGQTLSLSAPATSSFVAMNGLNLSSNGATASLYMSNVLDYYQNMDRGASTNVAVPYATNAATLMLQRLNQENNDFAGYITANTVLLNIAGAATSVAQTITGYVGIYTDNVTALSLLSSASSSWGTNAANANISSSFNGSRWFSFVSSQWNTVPNLSQGGEYVFGVFFRASGTAMSLSYLGQQYMGSAARAGYMGQNSVNNGSLNHGNFWNAYYSASVSAFPSTIASNAVTRSGASAAFMPHIILNNRYAGNI